jgi:hypothetical protein
MWLPHSYHFLPLAYLLTRGLSGVECTFSEIASAATASDCTSEGGMDSPGPPSPSLPQQPHRANTTYSDGQQQEQAFSNVVFQNVLFQVCVCVCACVHVYVFVVV